MDQNSLPSERAAVVGVISPVDVTVTTIYSGYIALALFRRLMAIIKVGVIASTGKVDAKFIAYTDGNGGGGKDVTNAAITQLTQAGTDANKQAIINLETQKLAALTAGTNYTHVRLALTCTTASALADATILGFDPLYFPASDNDLAAVDEIVVA